jgi:multiple sugar transport system permease protein
VSSLVIRKTWKYILLIIIAIIILFPIIWILLQSLKSYFDTIAVPPKFIFRPTLINYLTVFKLEGFGKSFLDSLIIAFGSIVCCIIVGTPFGYVLARYDFRGRSDIGFFILSTRMLPAIVVIVPLIRIFSYLNLIDTYAGVIFSHIILNLALVVWMTRGFFDGIPREVEEAAWIDGCSQLKTLMRVVFPLTAPGIVATSILAFLFSWNELLFSLTLTSFKVKPLPVFMASQFVGWLAVDWGGLSAAGIIAIIPTIVFITIIQKHIVRGLTFGAIK